MNCPGSCLRVEGARLRVYPGPVNQAWTAEDGFAPGDCSIRPLAEVPGIVTWDTPPDIGYTHGCALPVGIVADLVRPGAHLSVQTTAGDWIDIQIVAGNSVVGTVAQTAGVNAGNPYLRWAALWGEAGHTADLLVFPRNSGIKSEHVFHTAQSLDIFTGRHVAMEVWVPTGHTMRRAAGGDLEVMNEAGEVVFAWRGGLPAYDAAGERCESAACYELETLDAGIGWYGVTLAPTVAGAAWVADAARAFPVTVDPTVIQATAESGFLGSIDLVSWDNARNGTGVLLAANPNTQIEVTVDYSTFLCEHGCLNFGTAGLPAIASSSLHIRNYIPTSGKGQVRISHLSSADITLTTALWTAVEDATEGTIDMSTVSMGDWIEIQTTPSLINRDAVTWYKLREVDHDIANVVPDDIYGGIFYGPDTPGSEPYLEILPLEGDWQGPFTGVLCESRGVLSR